MEKGGVTIPILECIFNGAESITSFNREFDINLYNKLSNLYFVCISDNSVRPRKIVAGFFVKTSYTHHDGGFIDAVSGVAMASEHLRPLLGPQSSFLPARLGIVGSGPITEDEMLQIAIKQFLKHSIGGHA